jgi:hypothetical protein
LLKKEVLEIHMKTNPVFKRLFRPLQRGGFSRKNILIRPIGQPRHSVTLLERHIKGVVGQPFFLRFIEIFGVAFPPLIGFAQKGQTVLIEEPVVNLVRAVSEVDSFNFFPREETVPDKHIKVN